jgi:hypothetical protein
MNLLSQELKYINDVLSRLRFDGPDQNPRGIRDLLGMCERKALELERKVDRIEIRDLS